MPWLICWLFLLFLGQIFKVEWIPEVKLNLTFEFETEFNGEFREFKNCKKKSEDFAGNNLIFYIFLITFLRFEKAQIWRFDGEIEEKNIEKLTGENFTWFIASKRMYIVSLQ